MATLTNTRLKGESGQSIIELALTLPLLLIVVLGIFDFGFLFQRYEVVTNAAREGARVGVLPGYGVLDAQARAEQYLTAGGLAGTSTVHNAACDSGATVNGKRCTHAAVADSASFGSPAKTVQQITVTVSYDHEFTFVGPMMSLFSGSLSTVRMKAVSTMRREAN
jgi:Flp pilus assembly protein TadG